MNHYIALDIGGTQMRGACYPENSLSPVKVERIATRGGSTSLLERLIQLIQSIWPDQGHVGAIGAAVPGPVDPYQGVIIKAPNIPEWLEMPLSQYLEDQFHVPVHLGNDANMAAMGEWKYGAGKGHHHLVYITVSTGIGGGVILDDRLLLGVRGMGGELGHVTVVPDGALCGCGQRGHLETVAAGPGIARWTQEQLQAGAQSSLPTDHPLTAKEVSLAAQKGDSLAIAALARAGRYLGWALADYLHIFNPSVIVIGGGVSQSGALLFEPMKLALHERVMHQDYTKGLQIARAELGDDVGLMGALALAQS